MAKANIYGHGSVAKASPDDVAELIACGQDIPIREDLIADGMPDVIADTLIAKMEAKREAKKAERKLHQLQKKQRKAQATGGQYFGRQIGNANSQIRRTSSFLHFMPLGGFWMGAKYSHGVWEGFAWSFETYVVLLILVPFPAVRELAARDSAG